DGVKRLFDGAGARAQTPDHFFELLCDDQQPFGEGEAGGRAYAGIFDEPEALALAVDDAVAGGLQARVNAEHACRAGKNHVGPARVSGWVAGLITQPAASISSAG